MGSVGMPGKSRGMSRGISRGSVGRGSSRDVVMLQVTGVGVTRVGDKLDDVVVGAG